MEQAAPGERIRPSATVILWRRAGDLEVYLVERSRRTRFFPGYHAFPGGVVDEADGPGVEGRAHAALRELFEETGVLVADGPVPASFPRAEAREAADEPGRLARLLGEHGLRLDVARPREAATLLTPPFGPLRYDTTFFACELPEGESPEVDGEELVSGRWWRPADALRAWDHDALPIPPPTLAFLRLLAQGDDPGRVADASRATNGRPHHERFFIEMHPGVLVLPLRAPTLPPATTQNCWMLDGDTLLVVDPGTPRPEEQAALAHTLDALRRGREVVVVLTHHHHDHVAAAAMVRERYQARVLAHPATQDRLPRGLVDEAVEEGHVFDLGARAGRRWRVRVLHTPGHAPGHLALRDERWGAVFAGDLVSGVSTILVDPREGDMGQYVASLERCAALRPPLVLPGHGPALPGDAFAKTAAHRRMREGKVLAALGKEPRDVDALLPLAYDDTPQDFWSLAARSLESHLLDLERRGHARREKGGWVAA